MIVGYSMGYMSEQTEFPQQFTHSVKVEQSAKGARVTVHVFANSKDEAIRQAVDIYKSTIETLKAEKLEVAPIEVKEK